MKPSILIVDDDPMIRRLASELLMNAGYGVALARHGLEALDAFEHLTIALVVLDQQMPVMKARVFGKRLRERQVQTPILPLAHDRVGEKVAAQIDAAGVLAKPLDGADMLATVRRIMAETKSRWCSHRRFDSRQVR